MKDPQSIGKLVEQAFARIHRKNMQGMPILNSRITVQALGFQRHQGRIIGVVITPWLMTVVLLPAEDEDWSDLVMGQVKSHEFPSGPYKFRVNEIAGIGYCQMHSLHSPMNGFSSQVQAVKVAEDFMNKILTAPLTTEEGLADENPPIRVIPGSETAQVNLDHFATIEPHEKSIPIEVISETKKPRRKVLDRRSLLLGQFNGAD